LFFYEINYFVNNEEKSEEPNDTYDVG